MDYNEFEKVPEKGRFTRHLLVTVGPYGAEVFIIAGYSSLPGDRRRMIFEWRSNGKC